jgi:hypothetical protein
MTGGTMNPLELLKALEAIRDKAAGACADITATVAPNDIQYWIANPAPCGSRYIVPFDIHTIAHAACEAAYADMEAEGAAGDVRPEGHPV